MTIEDYQVWVNDLNIFLAYILGLQAGKKIMIPATAWDDCEGMALSAEATATGVLLHLVEPEGEEP